MQVIERDGIRYAEIIRADEQVPISTFYSPAESSFQFGIMAHHADFTEPAHSHYPQERHITDVQQAIVIQKGKMAVDFHLPTGERFETVEIGPGDAILLVHGAHAVRILEEVRGISVKQGPFLGDKKDKNFLTPQA